MTIHEASRTLLKSPPELWAECSDATSLRRHLDRFGEIRITRLEPETAVAWEGDNVSGTVKLEPSGWGTRVILTAEEVEIPKLARPLVDVTPPPPPPPEPVAVQRPLEVREGFLARLRRRWRGFDEPVSEPEPAAAQPPEPPPAPEPPVAVQPPPPPPAQAPTADVLSGALESLGMAHHRPFSRA